MKSEIRLKKGLSITTWTDIYERSEIEELHVRNNKIK